MIVMIVMVMTSPAFLKSLKLKTIYRHIGAILIYRGVEVAFVDACEAGDVKKAVTSATRLVWLEVMVRLVSLSKETVPELRSP